MKNKKTITTYKGFDKDLKCRDFQYEIGKKYTCDDAIACETGFHACENPIDVFNYYSPAFNKFHVVEQGGKLSRHHEDSKVASSYIKIGAEISIKSMVDAAFKFIFERCIKTNEKHATGYRSASSATGYSSAASATGDNSASSATGDNSASSATGYRSASSATGNSSAASATGNSSAASATGCSSAASATGDRSAASATGYRSAASATGDNSAASATGYNSISITNGSFSQSSILDNKNIKSINAIAMGSGYKNQAAASLGNWIVLVERDSNNKILYIKSAKVDNKKILANTFYELIEGKFVKCD